MLLCGRIFLGARFRPVILPQMWERKDCAREVHSFERRLAMDPFLSRMFSSGATVPLENSTVRFDPNVPSFRRKDFLG